MKRYILILFILSTIHLIAQEDNSKFDIRFGTGVSLLGSGDMGALNIENELNYNFNKYFASSLSVNYGRSNSGVYVSSSFIQGNLNLFVSPFKNTRKNDFRIGTGFSMMNISETYKVLARCGVGLDDIEPIYFNARNSCGFNVIVENTYSLGDKLLVGIKLFSQVYSNEDINSGVLLKFGLRL